MNRSFGPISLNPRLSRCKPRLGLENAMQVMRILREERGWSRAELARRAEMNATTVGQIEAGRLTAYPVQIQKLATALGVAREELQETAASS